MKYNFLIFSKTYGRGWVFFKVVSSLSLVCLSGYVDSLEDDVTGLDDVSLNSKSEL